MKEEGKLNEKNEENESCNPTRPMIHIFKFSCIVLLERRINDSL